MKKIILLLAFMTLVSSAFGGSLYNLDSLSSMTKAEADKQFEEIAKTMATALNGGLGDAMNVGLFKVGLEGVFVPFEKTGVLSNSPISVLPVPYLYGGVSIFGITPFARITMIPVKSGGKYPYLFGLGLGYEIDATPLFTIMPSVVYHRSANFDKLSLYSISGQIQARANLMMLTPYANLGISYNRFNTDITVAGEDFSYSKTLLHTALGLKVLFFFAEVGFTPQMNYSIGASIEF